jgi:hypothetical protein
MSRATHDDDDDESLDSHLADIFNLARVVWLSSYFVCYYSNFERNREGISLHLV